MKRRSRVLTFALLLTIFVAGTHRGYAQEPGKAHTPATEGQVGTGGTADPDANLPDDKDQYRLSPSTVKIAGWLHMQPRTASLLFELLNLAIVVIAIVFYIRRTVPTVLRNRGERLQKQLVEARTATDDANRRLLAVEERLSKLDDEIIGMRQQAERDMLREEERFRETLEAEKDRLVDATEQEIATAGAAARRELKKFAAELAVSAAEQRLQMTSAMDEKIVGRFASSLGSGRGEEKN